MRKVTFGGANSLDNMFASVDHSTDWLIWSDEVGAVMADYWKTIDAVVMGRKTYEQALRQGEGSGGSLPSGSGKGATIVADDAAGFVRDRLRARQTQGQTQKLEVRS